MQALHELRWKPRRSKSQVTAKQMTRQQIGKPYPHAFGILIVHTGMLERSRMRSRGSTSLCVLAALAVICAAASAQEQQKTVHLIFSSHLVIVLAPGAAGGDRLRLGMPLPRGPRHSMGGTTIFMYDACPHAATADFRYHRTSASLTSTTP
jgi:hypothetical protein